MRWILDQHGFSYVFRLEAFLKVTQRVLSGFLRRPRPVGPLHVQERSRPRSIAQRVLELQAARIVKNLFGIIYC